VEVAHGFERKRMAARVRRQILVIDDDAIVQEVLMSFLTDMYEVRNARTAADGLLKLHAEPIDLVVLDQRLPDRTGLDVLTELRSIWPALPVIMLTGYGSEWICAAAFRLGVVDYFPKPVRADDLVAALRRIFPPDSAESERPDEIQTLIESLTPFCIPIQRAMGLIQQRYWDHVSLSGVAHHVGMSKYRLSHRFREVLGITFRDYLLRVRLE
jgi:DNA-binding NtrC family response regulator